MFFFFYYEIWRDIIGYEGYYQVSNYGNVRSLNRMVTTSKGSSFFVSGRIMKQAPTTTCKYLVTDLCKYGIRVHYLTHILVAKAFYGDYPKTLEVNHIDGNIHNNCISNLELVTHKQNIDHSIRTGLKKDYGERHVHARLTNNQAQQIRECVKREKKQIDLAIEFKVSKQTICNIVNNKRYIK